MSNAKTEKPVIYQLLPRLFANTNAKCIPNGDIEQNGCGKMNDITPRVLNAIKELGVTHVWYTGVIEHAHATDYSAYGITPDNPMVVKGKAGSPYAISDYYDIDPDIAVDVPKRMDEFEQLVERTHAARMKVLIDFVPNHVARRYHSDVAPAGVEDFGQGDNETYFFSPTNNFYYIPRQQFQPSFDIGNYVEFPAKASGNDCFNAFPSHNDWYETVKLNYGVDYGDGSRHFDPIPPTWFKMLRILRYWASKGIDGFRCDMVFMVPVEFWEWAIPQVKEHYPNIIFIAEIYNVDQYREFLDRGHFDYLYDKVNLYDTLRAVQCCQHSAATITDCWQRVDGIGAKMLNFLENHDEQRFASAQYAGDATTVLPSLIVSSMMSTGPFMLYAGQELGEKAEDAEGFSGKDGRTTIFDYWSIPTVRRWLNGGKADGGKLSSVEKNLRGVYAHVLKLLNSEKALSQGEFFDLMYVNFHNEHFSPHRHYAFLRRSGDDVILIAVNFSEQASELSINLPGLALEMYEIKAGVKKGKELISGRETDLTVSQEEPFRTHIAPWGAVAWKFSASHNRRKNICRSAD
jgi:glycosidase